MEHLIRYQNIFSFYIFLFDCSVLIHFSVGDGREVKQTKFLRMKEFKWLQRISLTILHLRCFLHICINIFLEVVVYILVRNRSLMEIGITTKFKNIIEKGWKTTYKPNNMFQEWHAIWRLPKHFLTCLFRFDCYFFIYLRGNKSRSRKYKGLKESTNFIYISTLKIFSNIFGINIF